MSLFNIQQLRGGYRKKWFGSKNQNFDVFFEIAAVTLKSTQRVEEGLKISVFESFTGIIHNTTYISP